MITEGPSARRLLRAVATSIVLGCAGSVGTDPGVDASAGRGGGSAGNGTQAGPALSQLRGFQVRAGSPAIDKGVSITGNGVVDLWGNPLYKGTPDVGPYAAP